MATKRKPSWDAQRLFYHDVRLLQKRTRCSNSVCDQFVQVYQKYAQSCDEKSENTKTEKTIKSFDKKSIRAAGTDYMILHGCPKCNQHVYKPEDKDTNCPFIINADGTMCGYSRLDEMNEPYEVCILKCKSCHEPAFILTYITL